MSSWIEWGDEDRVQALHDLVGDLVALVLEIPQTACLPVDALIVDDEVLVREARLLDLDREANEQLEEPLVAGHEPESELRHLGTLSVDRRRGWISRLGHDPQQRGERADGPIRGRPGARNVLGRRGPLPRSRIQTDPSSSSADRRRPGLPGLPDDRWRPGSHPRGRRGRRPQSSGARATRVVRRATPPSIARPELERQPSILRERPDGLRTSHGAAAPRSGERPTVEGTTSARAWRRPASRVGGAGPPPTTRSGRRPWRDARGTSWRRRSARCPGPPDRGRR